MAIQDLSSKIEKIVQVISTPAALAKFTDGLGTGPDLYFYKKLLRLRRTAGTVGSFISDRYNLEVTYALLGLWKMQNRGARMRDFDSFVEIIEQARGELKALEEALTQGDRTKTRGDLRAAYERLHVMEGQSRVISNAKLFHFFMPNHLMPIDGQNTLIFLYGKDSPSKKRYLDIIDFSSQIRGKIDEEKIDWRKCLDGDWNSNLPKILDNAIFFLASENRKRLQEEKTQATSAGKS